MMNEGEYVLCKWKRRLWPAQILSRSQTSRGHLVPMEKLGSIPVKIISENKQVTVRYAHIEPLTVQSIEDIADKLGPSKEIHEVVEELSYRRALRELLEILKEQAASRDPDPFRHRSGEMSAGQEQDQSPAPQQKLPLRRSPRGTAGMGKAGVGPPGSSVTLSGPLGSRTESPSTDKPPSSASGDLPSSREPAQESCGSLKAPKPDISERLAAASQPSRRSSRASRKHRQVGSPAGQEASLTQPARTSTPASASRKRCLRVPRGKGRARATPWLPKNLLGPPVMEDFACQPADVLLVEEEALQPRKCRKSSGGTRHSPPLEMACPKQTPAAQGLSRKRGRARTQGESGEPSLDCALWGLKGKDGPDGAGDEQPWLPDVADDEADQASDLSPQLSPVQKVSLSPASKDEEEEEELPSILMHQEPCSFEAGMMVWCKLRSYPYWPAVVKRVHRKAKKANVLFIEKCMDAKKSKGFSINLKSLKHFDCEEKQMLIDKARENCNDINWCISLIADYRIRVGCHSFVGSFLEYCADDMSYPVRKGTLPNLSQMTFPQVEEPDTREFLAEATPTKQAKKILPDRTRAARDRANKRIVEFIVKTKGADKHLRAILTSKKQSRWLRKSLKTPQYLILETYLEDDHQQDLVLKYLKEVYWEVGAKKLPLENRDSAKFVLEVLFPEAIIYAISAVEQIDYKTAEEKYIKGPSVSQRERQEFEKGIQEKKQKKHQPSEKLSIEDEL